MYLLATFQMEGLLKQHGPVNISTLLLASLCGASAQAANETVQGMLAAQIRTQGFICDKAVGATRDAKRSRPDHEVWVLRCSNATYRISRAPDMAAKVEPLP